MKNLWQDRWQTIFESLQKRNKFVIIEDEINEQFAIGVIEKVFKNKLYFKRFDADGIWDEEEIEIPYSTITTVQWDTRYAEMWERYLSQEKDSVTQKGAIYVQ